jgi:hypothetical protein
MKEKILDVQDTGRKLNNGATVYHVITNNETRPILSCFNNRIKDMKGQEIEEGVDFTTTGREYNGKMTYTMSFVKKDAPSGFQGKGWQPKGKSNEELLSTTITMVASYSKDMTVAGMNCKLIKDMAEAQKYLIDTFEILLVKVRSTYLSILEGEKDGKET